MKKLIFITFIILISFYVNGQVRGIEGSFHNNIAKMQVKKGSWFYKNSDILISSLGKNFYDIVEIEAGTGYLGNIIPYYIKTRILFPINDNWDYGIAINTSDYSFYTNYFEKRIRREIFRKMEVSSGFTYLTNEKMHSINVNFGYMNHLKSNFEDHNAIEREFNSYTKYYSGSLTYVFSTKFNNKWGLVSDNKLYLVNVDFLLPDNCCNFYMFYSEQALSIRKINKSSFSDYGILFFLGVKNYEIKTTVIPYFSYTVAF